ncbi:MBL fold metallo-hydrolase [bacterium]|nr:MBL fold metallo-hydrolase [bacterium]MBU1983131.1 MBL fold metallo-hydrolase [bacterium]
MSLSLFILASGSKANAICLKSGNQTILIDAGLGVRSMLPALHSVGVRPDDLDAILLTHEHSDHVRGLTSLLARTQSAVYASPGTLDRVDYMIPRRTTVVPVRSRTVEIGSLLIRPIAVPHDAAEPLAFHIVAGEHRVTIATDLGEVPDDLQTLLAHSTCAVLESNHDEEMLRCGSYPELLKERIASSLGHLSNRQSAAALAECKDNGLRMVVLAHVSDENNDPDLARVTTEEVLDPGVELHVTARSTAGPFLTLE